MWIIIGSAAITTAILNLILSLTGKKMRWLGFLSLSLTALTLCAVYSLSAGWVLQQDWVALADTVPTVEKFTWVFTAASVVINGISLLKAGVKK